jgi:hypothetical protein
MIVLVVETEGKQYEKRHDLRFVKAKSKSNYDRRDATKKKQFEIRVASGQRLNDDGIAVETTRDTGHSRTGLWQFRVEPWRARERRRLLHRERVRKSSNRNNRAYYANKIPEA